MSNPSPEIDHGASLSEPSLSRVRRPQLAPNMPWRFFAPRLAALLGRQDIPGRADLATLRQPTRLLMFALVAWIGFIGIVSLFAIVAVEMSTLRLPAWLNARATVSTGAETRPEARYESILQRPLFSRSRQPAVASVAVAAPPLSPPAAALDQNITLKGVYIDGAVSKAFLLTAQNPLGIWVQVDEEIAGWRLATVEPEQILLKGQGENLEIALSVGGAK